MAAAQVRCAEILTRQFDATERARTPSFEQLTERARTEWWPHRNAPRQVDGNYRMTKTYWVPLVGDRPVDTITAADCAWVIAEAKRKGRHVATCNRILSAGSGVLQFAKALRIIKTNPSHGAELRQKEPRRSHEVLTVAEIDSLIAALAPRWRPLVGMMAYAGLRIGEALSMQGEDVDLERDILTVRRGGHTDTTKGKAARRVPIVPPLREILVATDLRRGQPVSKWQDPRKALRAACDLAAITKYVHPHRLRHSYGSALARAGISTRVIQELLGHADLSTTERYLHNALDPVRIHGVFSGGSASSSCR